MGKISVRELHLKTSELMQRVKQGQRYLVTLRGVPIAEFLPIVQNAQPKRGRPLPDPEAFIRTLKVTNTTRILEEDRF